MKGMQAPESGVRLLGTQMLRNTTCEQSGRPWLDVLAAVRQQGKGEGGRGEEGEGATREFADRTSICMAMIT